MQQLMPLATSTPNMFPSTDRCGKRFSDFSPLRNSTSDDLKRKFPNGWNGAVPTVFHQAKFPIHQNILRQDV